MVDVPKDIMETARRAYFDPFNGSDSAEGNAIILSIARALIAERERRTPDVVTWQDFDTAPKDGTVIMAWHTVHKCPMAIVWKERGFPYRGDVMNWYERSYTTAWPERCFSHWSPMLAAPSLSSGAGRSEERG